MTVKQRELKRLNIHLNRRVHDRFKAAATLQGHKMTDVLLEFIQSYIRRHLPRSLLQKKENR